MEKIQPETVVELLRQKGVIVSLEEAKLIWAFLKKLTDIAVTQYLKQ